MSWDSDRDHSDSLNGPYVLAACVDCARPIRVDYDPAGALCEECGDLRDAHSSALELRMVKAALPDPGIVTVALIPTTAPGGYRAWLEALHANAAYGPDALARAWYVAPPIYLQHLLTVTPDQWDTLKASARRIA